MRPSSCEAAGASPSRTAPSLPAFLGVAIATTSACLPRPPIMTDMARGKRMSSTCLGLPAGRFVAATESRRPSDAGQLGQFVEAGDFAQQEIDIHERFGADVLPANTPLTIDDKSPMKRLIFEIVEAAKFAKDIQLGIG